MKTKGATPDHGPGDPTPRPAEGIEALSWGQGEPAPYDDERVEHILGLLKRRLIGEATLAQHLARRRAPIKAIGTLAVASLAAVAVWSAVRPRRRDSASAPETRPVEKLPAWAPRPRVTLSVAPSVLALAALGVVGVGMVLRGPRRAVGPRPGRREDFGDRAAAGYERERFASGPGNPPAYGERVGGI